MANSILASKLKDLRKHRAQEAKKRKSFFPSFVIALVLWSFVILIILFLDPVQKGALELFFTTFFFACVFTFSLLLGHTRRGLMASASLVLFTLLLYLGVGTLFNLVLIIGAFIAFEIYFTKRK